MDTTTSHLASIGIDIGKEVFHIVGFSTNGKIAFRRKIKRLAPTLSAGLCVSLVMSPGLSLRSM
jgi:hypothetical protein